MNCENIAQTVAVARPDWLFNRLVDQNQPEPAEDTSFCEADAGRDTPMGAYPPTWPRIFPGL